MVEYIRLEDIPALTDEELVEAAQAIKEYSLWSTDDELHQLGLAVRTELLRRATQPLPRPQYIYATAARPMRRWDDPAVTNRGTSLPAVRKPRGRLVHPDDEAED